MANVTRLTHLGWTHILRLNSEEICFKIVKKVLTLKSYKKEIIDKKRISSILNKIKKESLKKNIDPKITQRIWKNMIWSYINFEKKNFRKK